MQRVGRTTVFYADASTIKDVLGSGLHEPQLLPQTLNPKLISQLRSPPLTLQVKKVAHVFLVVRRFSTEVPLNSHLFQKTLQCSINSRCSGKYDSNMILFRMFLALTKTSFVFKVQLFSWHDQGSQEQFTI